MNYKELNDFELLSYVQEENEEAKELIFKKYKPMVEQNARRLLKYAKNSGLDFNDLVQEGMVGLNRAIIKFNDNHDATFYTFAKRVSEQRQINAIVGSNRQKHKLLNESLSFELYNDKDEVIESNRILVDNSYNPETLTMERENSKILINKINSILTPFERQVFKLKVSGFDYKEIADILNKEPKQVDNALQRIKLKIKNNIK